MSLMLNVHIVEKFHDCLKSIPASLYSSEINTVYVISMENNQLKILAQN